MIIFLIKIGIKCLDGWLEESKAGLIEQDNG
jgi:hypothetical protein